MPLKLIDVLHSNMTSVIFHQVSCESPWLYFSIFNNRVPLSLLFRIVYKFHRSNFYATYYGQTKRYFKARIRKHLGILLLLGKNIKADDDSTVK